MSGSLRQRFAPIRQRVNDQLEQAKALMKKQPTLRELEKVNKDSKRLLDNFKENFKTLEELMDDMTDAAAKGQDDISRRLCYTNYGCKQNNR